MTYISDTTKPLHDVIFPSVTICNVNQVNKVPSGTSLLSSFSLPKDEAEFTGESLSALTSIYGVSHQLFLSGIKQILRARELEPDCPKYPTKPGLGLKSGFFQQVCISGIFQDIEQLVRDHSLLHFLST